MNIVIADRREFDRFALRALCEADHDLDLHVVATVERLSDAEQAMAALDCDVLLVGRSLLRDGGPGAVQRVRSVRPACRIILVGVGEDHHLRLEALRLGADGELRRDGDMQSQLGAISGTTGAVPRWAGEPPARASM